MDKITKISVDEQNNKYSVTTEDGTTLEGYQGLNRIRFRKVKNRESQFYLEAYIISREEQESRYWARRND